jgi:hypothetical protein
MDIVCQQIVNMICEAEVQHLLKMDGVRDASFGQAVGHNNNGNKIANGYISKLDIVGFSQNTKRLTRFDRTRRWTCDVTIAYNVVQEYTTMDDDDEDFSRPPIPAVNNLRQQFRDKYQI